MEPWYKVATPRKEVRQGRSFNPDEFAIALEQVVACTAPEDYRDPKQFFSRTYFTRALCEHVGMVLRRLAGETENTAPVLALITQFGGGKTHTLTALYHLINNKDKLGDNEGLKKLMEDAGLSEIPQARVGRDVVEFFHFYFSSFKLLTTLAIFIFTSIPSRGSFRGNIPRVTASL